MPEPVKSGTERHRGAQGRTEGEPVRQSHSLSGMSDFDPIYTPKKAAEYLSITTRTLRKLAIDRHPMPGTGSRFGYRLSALNSYLARIADPQSRAPRVRQSA